MAARETSLETSSEVEEILKCFAICFAKQFEKKIDDYFEIGAGKKVKAGKTFRWLAAGLSAFGGLGKAAAIPVTLAGNYFYKQTATAISKNPSFKNQLILREMSVKAAVSIFISYESQFMTVCTGVDPKLNLEIISEDAVERFFNYYDKANVPMPSALTSDAIVEGVVNGESKKILPLLPMMDNEVNDIYVADLFRKVGLVTLDSNGNPDKYYIKREGNKYGFRRLFALELEKIQIPKEKIHFFNAFSCAVYCELSTRPSGQTYGYVLKSELLDKYSQDALTEINQEDPKLRWQRLEDLIREINEKLKNGDVKRKRTWFGVNDLTSLFIGREKEEEKIRAEIERNNKVVVHGLPGIGKSELALKFAHTYYDDNDSVVIINAETKETASKAFLDLHRFLDSNKVDENENEDIALKKIIQNVYEIIDGEKILFIFDGAEEFENIKGFLPPVGLKSKKIDVLITSINEKEWDKFRGNWELIPLTNFSDDEAQKFIVGSLELKQDDSDASELAKSLSNFPLALLQAVCYIKEEKKILSPLNKNFTIRDYIKTYKNKEGELLKNEIFKRINDTYGKTTFTALKICLDKIQTHGELPKKFLDVLCCLAPNNIPVNLLSKIEYNFKKLGNVLNLLEQYSIVKLENALNTLSIHGLVQRVNRLELKENSKEEEILEILLKGMNGFINIKNFKEMLPHVVSIWNQAYKYFSLIQQFIAKTEINNTKKIGIPYFHLICQGNDYKIVEDILNKIDDDTLKGILNVIDKRCRTPVHYVAVNGDPKLLRLLIQKGAKIMEGELCEMKYRSSWTPLHLAAQYGNFEMVKALTKLIDIDVQTYYKFTPLNIAAKNGYLDIVLFLLEQGANVNVADKQGFTPLHYAVKNNHIQIINAILEKKVNVDAQTGGKNPGRTSLHIASRNGNLDIVKVLLDHRATVKIVNKDGFTPLHYAAYYNHVDIVKKFLEMNIEGLLDCVTSHGKTALDLAKEKGNEEIEDLIKKEMKKLETN